MTSPQASQSEGTTQTSYNVTLKVLDTTGAIVASSWTRVRKVTEGG